MTTTLTAREEAIKLLGQGKIRALVLAQTRLADAELDSLIAEVGDEEAMRRAAAAIRRGDRSWAEPPAGAEEGQPQPAAEATAAPMTPDSYGAIGDVNGPDVLTAILPPAAALAEAQAGLTAAEHSRAARMLATTQEDPMPVPAQPAAPTPSETWSNLGDSKPDPAGLGSDPASAVLTMPLARLVDADGTDTVIAEAAATISLDRDGLLAWFSGEDGPAPVVWRLERRLTPDGADIVRGLAALLEDGDGRG